LVFLRGKHPQQRTFAESETPTANDVGDGSLHHKIELQLNVAVAAQNRRVTRRIRQEQKPVIRLTQFQILKHPDKFRSLFVIWQEDLALSGN
jgi:hypothetical protein